MTGGDTRTGGGRRIEEERMRKARVITGAGTSTGGEKTTGEGEGLLAGQTMMTRGGARIGRRERTREEETMIDG